MRLSQPPGAAPTGTAETRLDEGDDVEADQPQLCHSGRATADNLASAIFSVLTQYLIANLLLCSM